tara:strand:- start:495 stop:1106 length:612 start_codon:yes stop_codon:yes gene_type:complete
MKNIDFIQLRELIYPDVETSIKQATKVFVIETLLKRNVKGWSVFKQFLYHNRKKIDLGSIEDFKASFEPIFFTINRTLSQLGYIESVRVIGDRTINNYIAETPEIFIDLMTVSNHFKSNSKESNEEIVKFIHLVKDSFKEVGIFTNDKEALLNVNEAMERLNVTKKTIYNMFEDNRLERIKVGSKTMITLQSIARVEMEQALK